MGVWNWIGGKTPQELQEEKEREYAELDKRDELHFNFQMEDGVPCLLEKIRQSIINDFDQWKWRTECRWVGLVNGPIDSVYEREDGVKVVIENCRGYNSNYEAGVIKIEETEFRINHDACQIIRELWQETEQSIIAKKKKEIIEKWRCE